MVDYQSDATIGVPATDVMRIQILQSRANALDAIDMYRKGGGDANSLASVKRKVTRLFTEVRPLISRQVKADEFKELQDYCYSGNVGSFEQCLEAFLVIDEVLDQVQLTRIDLKQKLGGNIKERNKAQGWRS